MILYAIWFWIDDHPCEIDDISFDTLENDSWLICFIITVHNNSVWDYQHQSSYVQDTAMTCNISANIRVNQYCFLISLIFLTLGIPNVSYFNYKDGVWIIVSVAVLNWSRASDVIRCHGSSSAVLPVMVCWLTAFWTYVDLSSVVHCNIYLKAIITVTSLWARLRFKSPASRLFAQPFVQAQIHWRLGGESPVIGGFPSQRASNAEYVSIWWRHHNNIANAQVSNNYNAFENHTFKSKPYTQEQWFNTPSHVLHF